MGGKWSKNHLLCTSYTKAPRTFSLHGRICRMNTIACILYMNTVVSHGKPEVTSIGILLNMQDECGFYLRGTIQRSKCGMEQMGTHQLNWPSLCQNIGSFHRIKAIPILKRDCTWKVTLKRLSDLYEFCLTIPPIPLLWGFQHFFQD